MSQQQAGTAAAKPASAGRYGDDQAPRRGAKAPRKLCCACCSQTEDPAEQKKLTEKISALLRSGSRGHRRNLDPASVREAAALVASAQRRTRHDHASRWSSRVCRTRRTRLSSKEHQTGQGPDEAVKNADKVGPTWAGTSRARWTKAAAAAPASIPPLDKREVGKEYDTPRGKAIWRGTGWELVKK